MQKSKAKIPGLIPVADEIYSIFRNLLTPAVLSGCLSGILLAVFDYCTASGSLSDSYSRILLMFHLVSMLAASGALISVVTVLLYSLFFTQIRNARPATGSQTVHLAAQILLTLLTTPGLIYVSIRLFQGGMTSRLPARGALIFLTACILTAAVFFAIRLCAYLIQSAASGPAGLFWWSGILITFCGGLLAIWADANIYRRLYQFLHFGLGAVQVAFITTAFASLIVHFLDGRLKMRAAVVISIILVCAAAVSSFMFGRNQAVRLAAYEHTASTRNMLLALSSFGSDNVHSPESLTNQVNAARTARQRRAVQAITEGLPSFRDLNFIMISIDALRADRLGTYGHNAMLTPNIDEWAKTAVVFDRAYCSAPHSSFSITSIHTSAHMHALSALGPSVSLPTMADILNSHGYYTTAFYTRGIFHTRKEKLEHYDNREFGFTTTHHGSPDAADLTDAVVSELNGIINQDTGKFFLWVHYFDVHEPYTRTSQGSKPSQRYDSEIVFTDRHVGRLLEYIENYLGPNTAVIFTADHGEEFKEHGGDYHGSTLYDEQLRVPLIIKIPGVDPFGVKGQVSLIDIATSVLALAGISAPASMQGNDLRGAIYEHRQPADPVFATVTQKKMVVAWPFKLIADLKNNYYELYDLEKDPVEKQNIYDSHRKKADELKAEIYAWLDHLGRNQRDGHTGKLEGISLGRLGDRRAVPMLIEILDQNAAALKDREEAARLLGKLRDRGALPCLRKILERDELELSMIAAISLGELGDDSGRNLLVQAMSHDDTELKFSAALTLAGLEDHRAVPVLIEALDSPDLVTKEKAIQKLGYLGDYRATEPLLSILPEMRTRYRTVVALGRIGDPRAYEALVELLDYETHSDVRGYAVAALGWLRIPEIIPYLIDILVNEPEIKWTSEALVRLGAIEKGLLSGVDADPEGPWKITGLGKCYKDDLVSYERYMNRTWCRSPGGTLVLEFKSEYENPAVMLLRVKHLGLPDIEGLLEVKLNGKVLSVLRVVTRWEEYRISVPGDLIQNGLNRVEIDCTTQKDEKLELGFDHLLLTPLRNKKQHKDITNGMTEKKDRRTDRQ